MRFHRPVGGRGRGSSFLGGGSSSFHLIVLIALMFVGQIVIISYMRSHTGCAPSGAGGQPLSLVASRSGFGGLMDDAAATGFTFGEDDPWAQEDEEEDEEEEEQDEEEEQQQEEDAGTEDEYGLNDDDLEPIWGEDEEEWGEPEDDDSGLLDEKEEGYEEDLLPKLPHPMIVGCISTMRTVSTTAFNLARVVMERVDPNSISGWEKDFVSSKTKTTIKDVVPKAHGKVSVVYKAHHAQQEYHSHADFFVSTYRDPYDIMCSMGHMFVPKIFHDRHFAVDKCARMAANERRILELAAARGPGKSLHIDSAHMHSLQGMTEIAERLIALWKVEGGHVNAKAIAQEVLALKSPDPGIFPVAHPRTELHAHHITKSNRTKADCERLRPWLEADGRCRAWHDRYLRMFPERGPKTLDDIAFILEPKHNK